MKLSNISKKYRSNTVLDNINFTLDSSVTGLIGKNGAGKTTMMKIMCSVIQNYSGAGLIFGIAGNLSTYFLAAYAGLEMPGELMWQIILHFILYTLFYGTLFLTISTFYNNVLALFIVALLSIMLLPSLLDGILMWDGLSEWVNTFIREYLPLYFLPEVTGSHNWLSAHYVSSAAGIILIAVIGLIKIQKRDY